MRPGNAPGSAVDLVIVDLQIPEIDSLELLR
jgi:CheY-like chemotaxis protein